MLKISHVSYMLNVCRYLSNVSVSRYLASTHTYWPCNHLTHTRINIKICRVHQIFDNNTHRMPFSISVHGYFLSSLFWINHMWKKNSISRSTDGSHARPLSLSLSLSCKPLQIFKPLVFVFNWEAETIWLTCISIPYIAGWKTRNVHKTTACVFL